MTRPGRTSVSSLLEEVLLEGRGLGRFVAGLTIVGADSAEASSSCSIQLDDEMSTAAGSDGRARRCAGAERLLGEGPADMAMALGASVLVDDQVADLRWPAYRAEAMREGVLSSMSVPLASAGRRLGVITLYSPTRRDLRASGLADLLVLASSAADALGFVELLVPPGRVTGTVTSQLADVQVAIGVLVALDGRSSEAALQELRGPAPHGAARTHRRAITVIRAAAGGPPPYDATPRW